MVLEVFRSYWFQTLLSIFMAKPSSVTKLRTYSDDGWRATWYEGPDGHRVCVALPPREHFANYGNGKVFLDHRSYDEDAEQSMLARLARTPSEER